MRASRRRYGEDAQESRAAREDLRELRAPLRVAEEMGQGLGRGEILLGPLPRRQGAGAGCARDIANRLSRTSQGPDRMSLNRFHAPGSFMRVASTLSLVGASGSGWR